MARERKMKGKFCERTPLPKARFDPRSFRYKQSGSAWILVGCPKGHYRPKRRRCDVGLRAHKILARAPRGACRVGRAVHK